MSVPDAKSVVSLLDEDCFDVPPALFEHCLYDCVDGKKALFTHPPVSVLANVLRQQEISLVSTHKGEQYTMAGLSKPIEGGYLKFSVKGKDYIITLLNKMHVLSISGLRLNAKGLKQVGDQFKCRYASGPKGKSTTSYFYCAFQPTLPHDDYFRKFRLNMDVPSVQVETHWSIIGGGSREWKGKRAPHKLAPRSRPKTQSSGVQVNAPHELAPSMSSAQDCLTSGNELAVPVYSSELPPEPLLSAGVVLDDPQTDGSDTESFDCDGLLDARPCEGQGLMVVGNGNTLRGSIVARKKVQRTTYPHNTNTNSSQASLTTIVASPEKSVDMTEFSPLIDPGKDPDGISLDSSMERE